MARSEFFSALAKLYPADRLLTRPAQLVPYESDALTAYQVRPQAVVIPITQEEVVETVRLCHQYEISFRSTGQRYQSVGRFVTDQRRYRYRPEPVEPHPAHRSARADCRGGTGRSQPGSQ